MENHSAWEDRRERNNEIMTVQVERRSKREGRLGNERETDVRHPRGLTPLACKYR